MIAASRRRAPRPRDERAARATAGGRPWRHRPGAARARRRGVRPARRRRRRARCWRWRRLLADLYGPRQLVREGWVPAEALASSQRYRLGSGRRARAAALADDVRRRRRRARRRVVADRPGPHRHADGRRVRAARPVGDGPRRRRAARSAREPATLASITSAFPAELRHALAAITSVPSPRIVLFSRRRRPPGLRRALVARPAARLHLVERPDLVVRQGRLWLRSPR